MKKENRKALILGILIFVVPIVCVIFSLLVDVPKQKENKAHAQDVLNMINENVFEFKTFNFSQEQEFKYKYKPSKIENVLLVHLKKDEWDIYSTHGLSVNEIKTKEDLDKIDVIAFAVSNFYIKTYQYNGSGVKVDISTEKVDIYLYNPKEDKLFIHRTLPYHELPKSTTSSHNYTHSVYDIESTVKKSLGIKSSVGWGIFGIIVIIAVVVGVIFGIKNFIKTIKK